MRNTARSPEREGRSDNRIPGEEELLSAIRARPDDPALRVHYADWLDKRGDPRGEYLLIWCELGRLKKLTKRRRELVGRLTELGRVHGAQWINAIQRDLCNNAPNCVQGFRRMPTQLPCEWRGMWDEGFRTVWKLSCNCGEEIGEVLGYRGSRIMPGWEGAEAFLSPLAFKCVGCGTQTEIIDTDRHGYHAEVAKIEDGTESCKARGERLPDRFICPDCREPRFSMVVAFARAEGSSMMIDVVDRGPR